VHPGLAEFGVDVRLVPGMTHEQVRAEIEAFLASLRREDPELDVEVEVVGGSVQAQLNGREPFVGSLCRASESVLRRRLPFGAYPAFTDAYHLHARAGIPTVAGFGPGRLTVSHSRNESLSLQSVHDAARIYALAAADYLG
jgi:acetylornithine deacetylase